MCGDSRPFAACQIFSALTKHHSLVVLWSIKEIDLIKNEIGSLLSKRYIEPARSPWSSNLVLVTKKDGSVRVCVDYRKLNDVSVTDAYPTPRVYSVVQALSGHEQTLDCEKGYYQLKISEPTKQMTAFTCPCGPVPVDEAPVRPQERPRNLSKIDGHGPIGFDRGPAWYF
jgi:hypothetical protein